MSAEEQMSDGCHSGQSQEDLARKKRELNDTLMQQALEQDNPMLGSIEVAAAELMDMASQIKRSIDESFNANANAVGALATAGPAFEQYLKCLRQADRFVHLDEQMRKPTK